MKFSELGSKNNRAEAKRCRKFLHSCKTGEMESTPNTLILHDNHSKYEFWHEFCLSKVTPCTGTVSMSVHSHKERFMKTKQIFKALLASGFTFLVTSSASVAQATLIGPTPYLSAADSPFSPFSGFTYFHLENFEDHLLNTPGVAASAGGVTSVVFGPSIHDSVDADDGSIDGNGLGGDSFFSGDGGTGITFTFNAGALGGLPDAYVARQMAGRKTAFNAGALGGLPDAVGIVWTDGAGIISFEAFDASNLSLGILTGSHADGSFGGQTAEDRFYGATNSGGISRIHISNSGGGIEVDHLQYGLRGDVVSVPEPAALALFGIGLIGLGAMHRRKV
jgi:hypothetical protein